MLALFADRIRPELRPLRDAETQELEALVVRRRAGRGHDYRREKPAQRCSTFQARPNCDRQDHQVAREAARRDRQRHRQRRERVLRPGGKRTTYFQSVPGVGKVLSRTLLSLRPGARHPRAKSSSPLSSASLPSIATVERNVAVARSGAVEHTSERSCTWARSSPPDSTLRSVPSMPVSGQPASYPRSPSSPACGSYSPSSTPSSATKPHGHRRNLLDPQDRCSPRRTGARIELVLHSPRPAGRERSRNRIRERCARSGSKARSAAAVCPRPVRRGGGPVRWPRELRRRNGEQTLSSHPPQTGRGSRSCICASRLQRGHLAVSDIVSAATLRSMFSSSPRRAARTISISASKAGFGST